MPTSDRNRRPPLPPRWWREPVLLVALGFGAGAAPRAPGTAGTLVALPLFALGLQLPWAWHTGAVVAAAGFGVWLCGRAERLLGVEDHPAIVWDEVAGYWITLLLAPFGLVWWALGFVLFRFLDIVKPGPIGWLNREVAGGWGVMVDDLAAGLVAGLLLQGAAWITR